MTDQKRAGAVNCTRFEEIQERAHEGDARAKYTLGISYEFGVGVGEEGAERWDERSGKRCTEQNRSEN